jgi:branched-chain amino acid transport system ATP-binding protein
MSLKIRNLSVAYGPVAALRDVSVEVASGRITTIIGSNGAGKTTIMKAVAGLLPQAVGSILFNDEEISTLRPSQIVSKGVALVPEGRRLFASMTVGENLATGAYLHNDKIAIARDLDRVLERFPILRERFGQQAGNLSGGQQQMLAVGRALMSRPRLLLLDEPSIGLAPVVVQQICEILETISREGVDVLLVEQNANLALRMAEFAYVLESGVITRSGRAEDLRLDPSVQEAYLGI